MSQLNKKINRNYRSSNILKNGMKNKDLSEKYKVHHSAV
ncbi:hypothetical protein NQ318_015901 [Aromia moschata]|uniref:Uncharacterized protein n=1 Tax=Aromia moschata TaxID=1265417 RepID=A0AAV8Y7K7_9CUCU|nr:hypothetical protein NQ318_015901 [Aromia moschata]